MRELIVAENITIDGVIDTAKGWFDPTPDPDVATTDLQAAMQEQGAAADALLLGRQTFEDSGATGRSRQTTRPARPSTSTR